MHRIVTENCESIDIKDIEQYIDCSKYAVVAVNHDCTDSLLCLAEIDNTYCWINDRLRIIGLYDSYKTAIRNVIKDKYTVKVVERVVNITIDGIKG